MDKRKATLTLAEKLNELDYISLVTDPAVKSYLLSSAKSVVLDLKKAGRVITHCIEHYLLKLFDSESDIHRTTLPFTLRGYTNANYFFIEKNYDSSGSRFFVTPAAVIGEAEERVLREKFYKNVPETILRAFEALEITNFIDAYNVYSSLKPDEFSPLNFGIYRPFKEGDKISLGDVIQGSSTKKYYLVDKIHDNGDIKGYRFQDESLKTPATGEKDDPVYGNCERGYVLSVKKRLSDINFFDFVFALPYEDQNIEVNKAILKSLSDSDSCRFLQKEYVNGKYFKDYFSVLSEGCQKGVVDDINSLPNQNKLLNSWLFSQGFDVKIDHLKLYKQDAKRFIDYFKRVNIDFQELIVADIFNCEHINKEVVEFLERDYASLLRDVSFKKETSMESS